MWVLSRPKRPSRRIWHQQQSSFEAGNIAEINVTVTCPKKHEVLEAFVYITQDGQTSQFSGIAVRKCKGKPIMYTVSVRAFEDTPFRAGEASASSYILVCTADCTSTISGGSSR
jgi:hypothetical protein